MRRSVGSVAPVRISVYDEENEENPEWQAVVIKGDPVSCFAAVRLIPLLVDDDHDADIVVEVPIHRAQHNLLVGKGGITLAALSATYETRIMIPPNEFMSNVKPPEGAQENIWETRQTQQNVGSTMLFGGENNVMASSSSAPDLTKNIIQLEGDIDKVEKCLVKILSIVAGEEKFIPTGLILQVKDDEIFAEATIVKIWSTSDSKFNSADNNNRSLPAKKQKKLKHVDVELERRRAAAATKMKELSFQQAPKKKGVRRCQVCFQESKTSKLGGVPHAQLERTGKDESIKTFCPFADDITIWKQIENKRTDNKKTWNKSMRARKKAKKSSNNDLS